MPQSTRPWPANRFCLSQSRCALLPAVVLALCAGLTATEITYGQSEPTLMPWRLPAVDANYASAAQFNDVFQTTPYPADAFRLVEYQEELPPGTVTPGDAIPYEEDIFPLDFDACGGCGSCGCACPDACDDRRCGRFFWGFYHAICCPDPCYDPCWWALSDAAFFVEAARPVTQTRLRWDAGLNLIFPDRAEYFWARSGGGGLGPAQIERSVRYHELSHYTEIAHGSFSAFFETPYRSYDADINPHEAGFGDLTAGTKSMLLDCELIQITFQMKFITPVGVSRKGLGTGHLSLEPSLLLGLNLSPHSYLQAQVAEWIPISADEHYAGALLHYHVSYNRTLLGFPGHVHVIGTAELNGWSFQDGAYSDPVLGQFQQASNETYLSGGFGLRMVLCDKIDFGVGAAIAITDGHWAEQLFRSELRVRF